MNPSLSLQTAAGALAPAEELARRLSAVYALGQENPHVFASPLGPFAYAGAREASVPRFVFFGPHTTDASWRVAFLAGFDCEDLRASHALLGLVEFLARHADEGYGLNLTFFPLVDVAGLEFGTRPRALAAAHWAQSVIPEITLLEKDARGASYHGFVRVETAAPGEDVVVLEMRAPDGAFTSPDVEICTSDDFESFPVRFERARATPAGGPLTIAADMPVAPFELVLRVPAAWPDELYRSAVTSILGRFIVRYRAFQAFGQHL
jgi:hypothetical protein